MSATLPEKIDEIFDQLDNIDSQCDLFFRQCNFTIYKSIALALRLVITGSSGDVGLLQDALPSGLFPRLRKVPDPSTPPDLIVLPAATWIERGEARVRFGNGTVAVKTLDVNGGAIDAITFGEMFDNTVPGLPIVDWIKQPFLRPTWTLRDFISTVANKDGAGHLNRNDDIRAMQDFGYFHWHLIAGLGKSLSPEIRRQLLATYPSHVRPIR